MQILVTVKEVSGVEDEFEIEDGQIVDRYLEHDLNEWDDYAIEEAVQISEDAADDVEVVTVTIGPERVEETIRMALSKGADRAIRVWDDALDSIDYLDAGTTGELLAAVAESEDPDLILTGVQSSDVANGATGVTLAEKLGFAWAAVVNELELGTEVASVHRELEGGLEELTDVEIPAVLTIQSGINDPRYASLRGIRQAQKKPLDVVTLDEIGLDTDVLDSEITLTGLSVPTSDADAEFWTGDADETAADLADFLQTEGVIES